MYNLPAVPSKVAYDVENPTQNQEILAGWMLDCAAAQRTSSIVAYTDEDFYLAAYSFDSTTMDSLVSASNLLTAEIEDSRGVIGDLLDIAATLIPVQYRFLFYLVKPFLNALAEKFFRNLEDTGGTPDFTEIIERLDTLNTHLDALQGHLTWEENSVDWSVAKSLYTALFTEGDPFLRKIEEDLQTIFLADGMSVLMDIPGTSYPGGLATVLKSLRYNDIEVDFGFIRALLFSRALMT